MNVNRPYLRNLFPVIGIFLTVSLFMTYNVIGFPSLVIGDNFYWTEQTTMDVLGPRVIRESFLGDIAVLSTFKTGFLFPLTYAFSALGIPVTVIYPFLFYFLCMLAFYGLSTEFLKTKFSVLVSVFYVVNPVTPYYFASLQNAFVLIFLPLILKFFIRSLREFDQSSEQPRFSVNIVLTAFFLSLAVSAHEQFILSAGLIGLVLVATYLFVCLRRYGFSRYSIRFSCATLIAFLTVFLIINLPLLLSVNNISKAPLSSYFTGRMGDFLANVQYTYSTANFATLWRFGGDSGAGLGQDSWYDSNSPTNLLGYSIPFIFIVSILLLALRKEAQQQDRKFFYANISLFITAFVLLLLVQQLPYNKLLLQTLFNFIIQTWESPVKIRIILLLTVLATALLTIQKLENLGDTTKKRIIKGAVALVLVITVVGYNSSWLIGYAGFSPLQQVSDDRNWGSLFDERYSSIANLAGHDFAGERGLVVPYTYKAQLYLPPNFRLFQMISAVNEKMAKMTQGSSVPWSKILGLLSAEHVIVNENCGSGEMMIFPASLGVSTAALLDDIRSDTGFSFQQRTDNFTIYENPDALPMLYATNRYVFYDDTSTLKYALNLVDLQDLPVFIGPGGQTNHLSVPDVVNKDTYEVYAISPHNASASAVTLVAENGSDGSSRRLDLKRNSVLDDVDVFSSTYTLYPGDIVSVPDPDASTENLGIDKLVLNSTSYLLGEYQSFSLNFTVRILNRGVYDFLGPRVTIDVGNSEKYLIIFHDGGAIELASLKGEEFSSGIIYQFAGFDLTTEENSIDVSVNRIFDEIQVWIDGKLEMSFAPGVKTSAVYLSSEQSTSEYTNISLKTRNTLRLFATRQPADPITFHTRQTGHDESELVVLDASSDYAVVSQYLSTPLRTIQTSSQTYPVTANVFFSGWIVKQGNQGSRETSITIAISNAQVTLGLTAFSISFAYLMCAVAVKPSLVQRLYSFLCRQFKRLKQLKIQRGANSSG